MLIEYRSKSGFVWEFLSPTPSSSGGKYGGPCPDCGEPTACYETHWDCINLICRAGNKVRPDWWGDPSLILTYAQNVVPNCWSVKVTVGANEFYGGGATPQAAVDDVNKLILHDQTKMSFNLQYVGNYQYVLHIGKNGVSLDLTLRKEDINKIIEELVLLR